MRVSDNNETFGESSTTKHHQQQQRVWVLKESHEMSSCWAHLICSVVCLCMCVYNSVEEEDDVIRFCSALTEALFVSLLFPWDE